MKLDQNQEEEDDIEFSDTSFLQLSVIVGDEKMQNSGRLHLVPQHTMQSNENGEPRPMRPSIGGGRFSDVTRLGKGVRANIVIDGFDQNQLRLEHS